MYRYNIQGKKWERDPLDDVFWKKKKIAMRVKEQHYILIFIWDYNCTIIRLIQKNDDESMGIDRGSIFDFL